MQHKDFGLEKEFTVKYKRRLLLDGLYVGVVAGILSVAFRYVLGKIDVFRGFLFEDISLLKLVVMVFLFFIASVLMDRLLRWAPYSGGSGIPQIRGELNGKISMVVVPTLLSKFFGGALANVSGLFLGREGPSIQLGGMAAKGLARILQRGPMEERHMITAGASAGLAGAFNAPISGALFALEEMHKSFSPYLLVPCVLASITANFVSFELLGRSPAFSFPIVELLPLHFLWVAIIIGVLGGVLGSVFNGGLLKTSRYLTKIPIPRYILFFVAMLLMIPLGLFSPEIVGGGNHLVEALSNTSHSLLFLGVVLLIRLVFLWISYGTGAQGGIFLPTLVIGALLGAFVLELVPIDPIYLRNFLYLGMVAVLTAVVRAPLLSILLVSEMSGSMNQLLSITTCSMVSYLVAEKLGTLPIYESLYENLMHKEGMKKNSYSDNILQTIYVPGEFKYLDTPLSDIPFPGHLLIINIHRNGKEFVPHRETTLEVGDELLVVLDGDAIAEVDRFFH